MAYLTAAQFLRLYDERRVRELLGDRGVPVGGDLGSNSNLTDILAMASETVAAAALVGKRYTTDQLTALAASSTVGFLLRRLVADIAFAMVVSRRGQGAADLDRLCPNRQEAERQLEMLRLGMTLFPGIDETHAEAGLPDIVDLDSTTTANRICKLTAQAARLFPHSCSRILPNDCGNC